MIGIDIEHVDRFVLDAKSKFIVNNFTKREINYAYAKTKPSQSLAGMFCVKEAFCKACGTGKAFKDIEVRHLQSGKPILYYKGVRAFCEISISHTKEMAVAVVIKLSKDR